MKDDSKSVDPLESASIEEKLDDAISRIKEVTSTLAEILGDIRLASEEAGGSE